MNNRNHTTTANTPSHHRLLYWHWHDLLYFVHNALLENPPSEELLNHHLRQCDNHEDAAHYWWKDEMERRHPELARLRNDENWNSLL